MSPELGLCISVPTLCSGFNLMMLFVHTGTENPVRRVAFVIHVDKMFQ
jgi:hypothetical protein